MAGDTLIFGAMAMPNPAMITGLSPPRSSSSPEAFHRRSRTSPSPASISKRDLPVAKSEATRHRFSNSFAIQELLGLNNNSPARKDTIGQLAARHSHEKDLSVAFRTRQFLNPFLASAPSGTTPCLPGLPGLYPAASLYLAAAAASKPSHPMYEASMLASYAVRNGLMTQPSPLMTSDRPESASFPHHMQPSSPGKFIN